MNEILLVDHHFSSLKMLGSILSEAGYRVSHATDDDHTVINTIKAKKPDLVLVDVRIPEEDGYQVYRLIKDDPVTSDIPIIFLTEDADKNIKSRCLRLGAADNINKPYFPEDVVESVEAQLDIKRARLMV